MKRMHLNICCESAGHPTLIDRLFLDFSRVGSIALSDVSRAIHPRDLVDELVSLMTETDGLDAERVEALVVRVHDEVL